MSEQRDRRQILPPGYAGNETWSGPQDRRVDVHRSEVRRREDPVDEDHLEQDHFEGDPFEDDPLDAPVRGRGAGRRSERRRGLHPVLVGLLAALALLLLLVVVGFLWAESQINPGGHKGPSVSVQIPTGSSTSRIGSILAKAGVIHNGTLFAIYVRINGDGPLLAGTYTLPKNENYKSAIAALSAGPAIVTEKLVIPEGYTIRQMAAALGALSKVHLSAAKFLQAASSGQVRSPYEPAGSNNLEGLLFPATYQVRATDSEIQILEEMVGAFNDHAEALGLTTAAARLHLSAYQVVTVASIVEREAKLPSDRGNVASVVYNRLRAGMSLGLDSTQTYYLRLTQPHLLPSASQLEEPSLYNTRLIHGLPPTPISNPGLASLQAAASPPSTSYLYFVLVNSDGQLGFASTNAGFVQLQNQCRAANLC